MAENVEARSSWVGVLGRDVRWSLLHSRVLWPVLCLLLCTLLFHWLSDGSFFTPRNLSNLSRQVCINLTLAVGMTLVILTSGIDLSVGSVLALSGMVGAITQVPFGWSGYGVWGALASSVCALAVGALAGLLVGLSVSRLKITPFIVTLGMMVICRGLALIISGAQAVAPIGDHLGRLSSNYLPVATSSVLFMLVASAILCVAGLGIFRGRDVISVTKQTCCGLVFCGLAAYVFCGYRGIPYMVFVALSCAASGAWILKYTRYGRFIYAIGGNREAAELSGVPVRKTLWITYFLMGFLAGLAGLMDIARVNGAVPVAGELAELDAIAAVVIGGTSLMGGIGGISGTLFGVLIMGVLNNGMSLVGISDHYQKVFKGLVIILAVYLDLRSKKK